MRPGVGLRRLHRVRQVHLRQRGKCHRDDASSGAPCGAGCGDGVVISAGTCDGAGQCAGQVETKCPMNYGCNPATKACNNHCSSFADCSSTGFCVTPVGKCDACGIYPLNGPACTPGSTSCETCSGDTCVETCDDVGECNGSTKVVNAGKGAARLVCNGQCNGITVNCVGPFPCEVVCDSNGLQRPDHELQQRRPVQDHLHGHWLYGQRRDHELRGERVRREMHRGRERQGRSGVRRIVRVHEARVPVSPRQKLPRRPTTPGPRIGVTAAAARVAGWRDRATSRAPTPTPTPSAPMAKPTLETLAIVVAELISAS